jgi:hypothetical protein
MLRRDSRFHYLYGYSSEYCWRLYFKVLEVRLSLSRLNHWLPQSQAHLEGVQSTAECHHQITDARLPQADPVLHDAAALNTTVDMLDP